MIVVAAFLVRQADSAFGDLPRLIRQTRNAYRTCKTYRDAGTQTIWNLDRDGRRTLWGEWGFSTIFLRPGQLRCELREPSRHGRQRITSVLWVAKEAGRKVPPRDPSQPTPYPVHIYTGLDRSTRTTDDFVTGLSSFASICFGGVDKVPSMLLPSDLDLDPLAQKDLRLIGSERVVGRVCSVLGSKELATKFWFDKRTGLLIKLEEMNDVGTGRRSLKVIQYSPEIGTPVDQTEFTGPKTKKTAQKLTTRSRSFVS